VIFWIGLALATTCPDDLSDNLGPLQATGDRTAYECLAENESSQALLMETLLYKDHSSRERLSRAVALWRLKRLETPISGEEARAYLPADIRLLMDGIHAFRGRATPSPEHLKVFEQLDWYSPDPRYTDTKLLLQDAANLDQLRDPPKGFEPAVPLAPTRTEPIERSHCGCQTDSSPAGFWAILIALILYRRRDQASIC